MFLNLGVFGSLVAYSLTCGGLAVSITAHTRGTGLSSRCSLACTLFFFAAILHTAALSFVGESTELTAFTLASASCAGAVASALFALWGMADYRRRRGRYSRGWKRAHLSFWLSLALLLHYAGAYYIAVRPELVKKLQEHGI